MPQLKRRPRMKVAADEVERRMNRFEETCEVNGLRRTPQRMAVCRDWSRRSGSCMKGCGSMRTWDLTTTSCASAAAGCAIENGELDSYEPRARVKIWGTIREVRAEVRGVCKSCEERAQTVIGVFFCRSIVMFTA